MAHSLDGVNAQIELATLHYNMVVLVEQSISTHSELDHSQLEAELQSNYVVKVSQEQSLPDISTLNPFKVTKIIPRIRIFEWVILLL